MSETLNWWARHYQMPWRAKANDPKLPKWFRTVALAYGSHAANGHAAFGVGEVAEILGTVDRATGVVSPDRDVRKHIRLAVTYGLLAAGSSVRCLRVPAHAIEGGRGGAPAAAQPCPWCSRRRNREAQSRLTPTTGSPVPT